MSLAEAMGKFFDKTEIAQVHNNTNFPEISQVRMAVN